MEMRLNPEHPNHYINSVLGIGLAKAINEKVMKRKQQQTFVDDLCILNRSIVFLIITCLSVRYN